MNGFAALDIPPCRRYVVVKATAGFAVSRLILKLLLFYSCLDFTQNLGKTHSFGFIGYKSFRKYLTAPPQEDVLAAAKELLSQQFQNLRVLNSQPPALAKHTKGDLHSIEQISERMLSTPTESSVEFMVAELDDALQSLMFRWNICYERYSSFRLSDNEKKKIGLIIQSGIDFLQKKKEVPL